MAAVTSIPPQLPYSRRVSFNNLRPDESEPNGPPDATRFHSYTMSPKDNAPKSSNPELSRLLVNYSLASPTTSSSRKRLRLPEPPSKSILKNKLSREQLLSNAEHAVDLRASLNAEVNDLINNPPDHVPRSELARVIKGTLESSNSTGEEFDSDDDIAPEVPSHRRKSYSGMTADELMALDPQFSKPNTSDLKDFKFDPLGTSYSTPRRASTPAITFSPAVKGKQVFYPSSNENNYKSVSFTVKHEDFDHTDIPTRTILSVISGRKHTWNSLDWLLLTDEELRASPGFLQDGDHLVVAALVPLKFLEADSKSLGKRKESGERKVQQKCEDILAYILNSLPDSRTSLKITVELVMDAPPSGSKGGNFKAAQTGTKFMMSHLYKQYQPTLVAIGNKSTSLNFKYPRRLSKNTNPALSPRASISTGSNPAGKNDSEVDQYLIKLSSYMVRYSTVPVLIVGNSTKFHRKPASKISPSVKFTDSVANSKSILDTPPNTIRHNSYNSDGSIESFCGEQVERDDEVSRSSPHSLELETQSSGISDSFASMLSSISSKSLAESKAYLEQIKCEKLPAHFVDSRVHDAYLSSEQGRRNSLLKTTSIGGAKAYKVKSLISYDEEEEKKNERLINDKRLKKSISRNSVGSATSGASTEKSKKKKSFLQRIGLKKS